MLHRQSAAIRQYEPANPRRLHASINAASARESLARRRSAEEAGRGLEDDRGVYGVDLAIEIDVSRACAGQ